MKCSEQKNNLFGDALRQTIASSGINGRELAADLGFAEFDLSRILSGATRPPKKIEIILSHKSFTLEQRQMLKAAYAQEAICKVTEDPEVLIIPRDQDPVSMSKSMRVARVLDNDKELSRAVRMLSVFALGQPKIRTFLIHTYEMLAAERGMAVHPLDSIEDDLAEAEIETLEEV